MTRKSRAEKRNVAIRSSGSYPVEDGHAEVLFRAEYPWEVLNEESFREGEPALREWSRLKLAHMALPPGARMKKTVVLRDGRERAGTVSVFRR